MNNGQTFMNQLIKNLNGHSGCKVKLLKDKGFFFVRKETSDEDYNFRLKKQYIKQYRFIPPINNLIHINTPSIFNKGYKDGKFFFDMEYIEGETLAEYFKQICMSEIANFVHELFASVFPNGKTNSVIKGGVFAKKIDQLKLKTKNYTKLKTPLKLLENFDWSNIPETPCHGDLTLENILITQDKKLYLLDFLDSFCNSWMIDIAKLLQDLELKWSFRDKTLIPEWDLKLSVAYKSIIEEILKTENGKQKVEAIYNILLLNIIRIYPYTQDFKTLEFLDGAVDTLMHKLNSGKGGIIL